MNICSMGYKADSTSRMSDGSIYLDLHHYTISNVAKVDPERMVLECAVNVVYVQGV